MTWLMMWKDGASRRSSDHPRRHRPRRRSRSASRAPSSRTRRCRAHSSATALEAVRGRQAVVVHVEQRLGRMLHGQLERHPSNRSSPRYRPPYALRRVAVMVVREGDEFHRARALLERQAPHSGERSPARWPCLNCCRSPLGSSRRCGEDHDLLVDAPGSVAIV